MSSWHFHQLRFAFGIGGFMSFYGIAGLIVWVLGDKFGLGVNLRIVVIGMVLLTMPIALLIGYAVSRRGKKKAAKAKAAAEETQSEESAPDSTQSNKKSKSVGTNEDISKGAEEVIKFLKESNLGSGGKESAYSLPWYLVVGTPTSGKSALVLGSGLNFQNLPSQRQSEQNFVRPTRQVDWRVTSDAVFIDTAGRYQSDNGSGDEWAAVIETIKKHRQKRPIDGLLLAVNTERILQASARQIDEQAKIIRERLDEATKLLKTKFPVYLVFTHADAIEGFRDSFSTSKNEGENLVWGTTIPLEKSDNAQALFDSEYELLQDSIMKRRLMRLSAPFSPVRQLRIFNFPLHFGSARRKLGTFVTTLFRPNPFSESPFLRGFYFTAVPTDNSQRSKKPTANKGKTVGKTYFTKKFFRDVVLRDKDLVKTFQEQKQRPPIIGWLLTTFGTLLTLLIITLAGISLFSNRALVNDAAEKGDAVWTIVKSNKTKDPLSKKATEIRDEMNATENLRRILVKLDKHEREGAPFYMRLGLYSGNRIYKEKLLNIYYTVIEQRYQAPVKRKIENELKQFATTRTNNSSSGLNADQIKELGEKFALLQAYLMWSGIKDKEDNYRAVPELLSKTIEPYWLSESKIPTDLHERAKAQMEFYFKQVDRRGGTYFGDTSGFPHLTQRQEVVDGARTKLKAFPPYLRYLKRVTSQVPKEIESVSVETILAGESQGAIEGTYTIPAAYTIEGYRNFIKEKLAKAEEEIGKDDWVMGDKAGDAKIQSSELAKLEDRYFNLYTDNWRQLVSNTKITSYKRQEDMDTALKAFSSTSSPMTKLLKEIARNTNFTAKPEAKGWMDFSWISDWWNSSGDKLEKGQSATVENEFGALFDFVGSGDKPKDLPISKYGADIKKVADVFTGLSPEKIKRIQRALANDDDKNREVSILKRSQKNKETK